MMKDGTCPHCGEPIQIADETFIGKFDCAQCGAYNPGGTNLDYTFGYLMREGDVITHYMTKTEQQQQKEQARLAHYDFPFMLLTTQKRRVVIVKSHT